MCVCLISVMSSAEFMFSVGHQVLTPRGWPCKGGGQPQSWHLFLSTVLAFLLFIRKRQIRQAKAEWKRGILVSTSAFVFHQPLFVDFPSDEENNYCYDASCLMMLSLGCWVVVGCSPLLLTHGASKNSRKVFYFNKFTCTEKFAVRLT